MSEQNDSFVVFDRQYIGILWKLFIKMYKTFVAMTMKYVNLLGH